MPKTERKQERKKVLVPVKKAETIIEIEPPAESRESNKTKEVPPRWRNY